MFKLFKGKEQTEVVFSPVAGKFVPLGQVADPVFAQKMAGDGFAIQPTGNQLFAPVTGEVTTVFKTKHAIGLRTATGLDILVHIGIDTVDLNGEPFEILVKEGQSVNPRTLIAKVNFELIRTKQKLDTVLVLITNMDQVKSLKVQTPPVDELLASSEVLTATLI